MTGVQTCALPISPPWQGKQKAPPRDRKKDRLDALDNAFAACDLEGVGEVSQTALVQYSGKTKKTVQNWVDEHPGYVRENGIIRKLNGAGEG